MKCELSVLKVLKSTILLYFELKIHHEKITFKLYCSILYTYNTLNVLFQLIVPTAGCVEKSKWNIPKEGPIPETTVGNDTSTIRLNEIKECYTVLCFNYHQLPNTAVCLIIWTNKGHNLISYFNTHWPICHCTHGITTRLTRYIKKVNTNINFVLIEYC